MADSLERKKDSRSPLRKAFDTVERAVANRAEPMAQSGGFASALGAYVSVNRGVRGVLGKATGGLLHLVKIPTTGDIGKLHQHLSSVDTHISELIRATERAALEQRANDPKRVKPAEATTETMSRRTGQGSQRNKSVPSTVDVHSKPKAGARSKAGTDQETTGR
jgi:hypothetical protein